MPAKPEPKDAEIIIIGGGIVGCSIAYHLTRNGKKDVMLLEKSGITHGSTWHAVGMIGQLRAHKNYTRMNSLSFDLYNRIEAETGLSPGFRRCGSMRLASSERRWREIRRQATQAKSFGFNVELLGPNEIVNLCPIIDPKGVVGAAYMPTDGYVDPSGVTQAIAKGARMGGARMHEGVLVTGIAVEGRRAVAVETSKGRFRCETLVCAAGNWSNRIGRMAGVAIPTTAVMHQYLVTEPIKDLPANIPGFRDPDRRFYLDPQAGGRLAMGGFESRTKSFDPPWEFAQELLPSEFDRFEELVELSTERVPVLATAGIKTLVNGPIPVSPDGNPILGRAPELDNFYVAAGMTAGIASGGGAGKVLADWIVDGQPPFDVWPLDLRRFPSAFAQPRFLAERVVEVHTRYYNYQDLNFDYETGRRLRLSPLYAELKARGAVFGSKFGWERPNWFAPNGEDQTVQVAAEHEAVRERVALIDQTSFAKLEILGSGALPLLQRLAANDIDRPIGSVIYTQLLTERGGIKSDIIVTRLAGDRFYVVTGTGFPLHDFGWLNEHAPRDGTVTLTDVTSARAVINICGPKSREVLQAVTDSNVSNAALPYMHMMDAHLGLAPVRIIRAGFVGELGYELHIPAEQAVYVYSLLMAAGASHGIANVGYRAIDSLRLEKGYRVWGTDLTSETTPYEAGLGPFIRMSKGDFIGKSALSERKHPAQVLSTFTVDGLLDLRGGEPILGDGKLIGHATSGGYGYTVGKSIVLGYVPASAAPSLYQVEAEGELHTARRHDKPLYDPDNRRVRS